MHLPFHHNTFSSIWIEDLRIRRAEYGRSRHSRDEADLGIGPTAMTFVHRHVTSLNLHTIISIFETSILV